ncbi:unnamed protein product [Trichobilharzia szidati]|nr:unnamed protein product [Trichobilharzia szidati]
MELEEIDTIPDDICEEFDINRSSDQNSIRISGYVSKPPNLLSSDLSSPVMNSSLTLSSSLSSSSGKRRTSSVCGHSSSERQFIYVNGRPCDLPKLTRLATDLWRRCSREAYSSITSGISLPNRSTYASFPVLVLMLTMPTKTVDINLTPDKRTLLLHHENYVLALAKAVLVKTLFNSIGMDIDSLSQSRLNLNESQIVTMTNSHAGNDCEDDDVGGDSVFGGSQEVSFSTPTYPRQSTLSDNGVSSTKRAHYSEDIQSAQIEIINLTPETSIRQSREENIPLESSQPVDSQEGDVENCDEIDNMEDQIYFSNIHLESTEVNFSMDDLRNRWSELLQALSSTHGIDQSSRDNVVGYVDEQNNNNNTNNDYCDEGNFSFGQFRATEDKEAENELTMYFKKETFNSLQVLGQFNLGFIIARHHNDLFIIDQHASDEKYRFEQLAENYRFKSQPLVVPQKLHLTIANEQILISNLDVFAKNGFAFRINYNEPLGEQVFLVAAPMLENKLFSYRDIEEMLFVLSETCTKKCRPSRLRDILASKSCRSAVMIGTALDHKKMKRILTNMSTMDHPWNCPHGRPTMRHLFHLGILDKE